MKQNVRKAIKLSERNTQKETNRYGQKRQMLCWNMKY